MLNLTKMFCELLYNHFFIKRILVESNLAIMVELAQLLKIMKPRVNAHPIGKAINAK